jgi:hypothetical protein
MRKENIGSENFAVSTGPGPESFWCEQVQSRISYRKVSFIITLVGLMAAGACNGGAVELNAGNKMELEAVKPISTQVGEAQRPPGILDIQEILEKRNKTVSGRPQKGEEAILKSQVRISSVDEEKTTFSFVDREGETVICEEENPGSREAGISCSRTINGASGDIFVRLDNLPLEVEVIPQQVVETSGGNMATGSKRAEVTDLIVKFPSGE